VPAANDLGPPEQPVLAPVGRPPALPAWYPRDPGTLLPMLDRLIERLLLEDDPAQRKSVGVVFDYAQSLVPAADLLSTMARGHGANLVRFLSWAQNPYIKRPSLSVPSSRSCRTVGGKRSASPAVGRGSRSGSLRSGSGSMRRDWRE
jgi:hypothetical protein